MNRQLEIAGTTGFVATFFTFACILLAIASWQEFNWAYNALSDLGVQNGLTGIVFTYGLVVGGILFAFFAVSLFNFAGKYALGKVGSVFFALACISLICIGVFNENFIPTHYIFSVLLFVFMPISLLFFVGEFWLEDKHVLSVVTLASALVAAAVWVFQFTFRYFPNVAIPEFVSGLSCALWVCVISYLMLKNAVATKQ